MQRRNYLALSSALLTTTIAGCSGDGNGDTGGNGDNGSGNTDTPEPTDTTGSDHDETHTSPETEADTETETETPEDSGSESPEAGQLSAVGANTDWLQNSTSLSGSGQTVTDTFSAQRFTTFTYEHNGESNFIAELINDETGDGEGILVNKIGSVSGTTGTGLQDGSYYIDIDADGDWSFEIGEPAAPDGEWGVPPASIQGQGSEVYGEVDIDGRVTVRGSHDGESNFIVEAWEEANTSGYADALIFNEIGSHEGETTVQLSGVYYIAVQADGNYQIEIE